MKNKLKTASLWVFALIIVIGTSIYQRLTGPTYPKREKIEIGGNSYKLKLLRSHGGNENCKFSIFVGKNTSGKLHYRLYPTKNEFTIVEMVKNGDSLQLELPHQAPAGKLEYFLEFSDNGKSIFVNKEDTIIIRFKGDVPQWVLIPHIFMMFFSLFFITLSALYAITNKPNYKLYAFIALVLFTLGGLVFGPIVQKFAFGEYWTGIPWGWDLTDNKTLFGFIAWVVAVMLNLKKERRWAMVVGALFVLIIFSIPHSMHGSERNPETGKIISA